MNRKILVIDDEALILSAVERALSKVGYFIRKAQNMKDLETALTDAPFDLLISDLHMEEASWESFVEKVKSRSPDVRVLLMSGSTARRDTFEHFIEKPFRIEDLRNKVRDMLDGPS